VVTHHLSLPGAQVRIILEIEADIPDGIPDKSARIVGENCRSLLFTHNYFKER